MSENTVDLTKEEVLVGLSKGLGLFVPDVYTKDFGLSVIQALSDKFDEYAANVPSVVSGDYAGEYIRNRFIEDLATNIGLEINDQTRQMVSLMVSEAGDAVEALNKSVDAGSVVPLKAPISSNVETRTETRMVTETVPDRELSPETRADIKLVQTLLSDAIGRTNQLRDRPIVGRMLELDNPLNNIGIISDEWSEDSLGAVNAVIDMLKERNGLSDQFPESGYTPELGRALQQKMEELKNTSFFSDPTAGAQLEALEEILPEDQRAKLFAALDRLSVANEMRPVTMVTRQVEVDVQVPVQPTEQSSISQPAISQPATTTAAAPRPDTSQSVQEATPTARPQQGETAPQQDSSQPTPGASVSAPSASGTDFETKLAISVVEGVLLQVGGHLDKMPGMGMVSQFGLVDRLVTPLTEADLRDGGFGQNSQDMAAKLIMGLKMVDGQKNVTGEYNHNIGENLRVSILTKPEFQFIRDQIKSEDGTPLRFFGGGGGALTGMSAEEQKKLAIKLLTFDEAKPEEPPADAPQEVKDRYDAQMKAREQFEKTYEKDLQAVRQLNAFFESMDILQRQGIYDNEKAKQTNKQNLMLDAASAMLDQWNPGIKSWLKDFFTNSQFGQMISGVLSQFFGINVGRLWGDKDDNSALERSKPLIEDSFASFYNDAREELGSGADHKAVISRTRDNIVETMNDSWKFKAAMRILFDGQDEDVVRNAVERALDAAQGSTDLKSAQKAFSDSLLDSGREYRKGQNLSDSEIDRLNAYLMATSQDIQEIAHSPDLRASPDNSLNNGSAAGGTSLNNSSGDIAAVMVDGAGAVTGDEVRARDGDAPAVDAEVIKAGEKNIELVYTPNKDEWVQGPMRYSHGRVADIQSVLGDNSEILGLSLNADGMKNSEGNYSDMLTPYTNAVIEETLIRAQIHDLQEQGVVITQDHLDSFDRKLTTENLHTFTSYLEDMGVSATDIAKLSEAIIGADGKGLGTDYYSTDPKDPSAGAKQDYSVLEQSHFGNQFDLKIAQWVPVAAIETTDLTNDDPLRDKYLEYNKDRPCEIPMFYKKEGSDSVFALIRDKNGNDDPSDDKFIELEYDSYLLTHRIQDEQAPELRAILDNYNWENPTERGVRNVINKVLGIEPFRIDVDIPSIQARSDVQNPVAPTSVPREEHKRPEVFRDLRSVTKEQADFLVDKLGLERNNSLMLLAQRQGIHPLEAFFEQQIRASNSQQNRAIFLELDAHGIKADDIDVVVAIRSDRGDLEFRYVDYETDAIRPLSEQRAGNTDITGQGALFNVQDHASGQRRLDDFMDEIDRHYGAYTDMGVQNGYFGMSAIIADPSGEIRTVNGFQGVYGVDKIRDPKAKTDYMEAYATRRNGRNGYELQKERDEYRNSQRSNEGSAFGISDRAKRSLDEATRHRLERNSDKFNDTSGANSEDSGVSSSIDQNMRDMGADIADAAIQQQNADVSHSHAHSMGG